MSHLALKLKFTKIIPYSDTQYALQIYLNQILAQICQVFCLSLNSLSAEGELTFKLAASADQQPTHGRCCTSSTELRLLSFFVARAVRKAGQISRIFPEKYSGKN